MTDLTGFGGAGNLERVLDGFQSIAETILRDAGQPSSPVELREGESLGDNGIRTVGARIIADESLPEQVRFCAELVGRCARTREEIAAGQWQTVAHEVSHIWSLASNAQIAIDAPAFQRGVEHQRGTVEGIGKVNEARQAGAARRRDIAREEWKRIREANPKFNDAGKAATRLSKILPRDHQGDFPNGIDRKTVKNYLDN